RRPLGSPCVLRSHPALHSFPTRRSSDLRPRLPPIQFAAASQCVAEQSACQTRRGIPVIFRRYRWPILFSLLIKPLAEFHIEGARSEEHTSELQSRENLVCRLLLEKKKTQ